MIVKKVYHTMGQNRSRWDVRWGMGDMGYGLNPDFAAALTIFSCIYNQSVRVNKMLNNYLSRRDAEKNENN
jgi:hypothetical protein